MRAYGWVKDKPDELDYTLYPFGMGGRVAAMPNRFILSGLPPIQNQGNLGSCTAQATGSIHHYLQMKQKDPSVFQPSRLFLYYVTRMLEGTVNYDSGAQIRNSVKAAVKYGICTASMWPYNIKSFKTEPPRGCWTEAEKNQAVVYARVGQNLDDLKGCIYQGFPITFGFIVYSSFNYIGNDGMMPMPRRNDTRDGGHAIYAVGWDDDKQAFIIVNSWGSNWGNRGLFYMPYEFALDPRQASDFWTIREVEGDQIVVPDPVPTPEPKPEPTPDGMHKMTITGDLLQTIIVQGRNIKYSYETNRGGIAV